MPPTPGTTVDYSLQYESAERGSSLSIANVPYTLATDATARQAVVNLVGATNTSIEVIEFYRHWQDANDPAADPISHMVIEQLPHPTFLL